MAEQDHRGRRVNLFYSPDYVGSAHAFETTRKAKWVADSLASSPIAGVELVEPQPLTWDQVVDVHDPDYARAVQTGIPRHLAESQGFKWDPGLWPMVLSSNGGAVAACLDALEHGVSGSLSSGLHHARRGYGAGFCTFNGLVMAARAALAAGAESVLILDLDAHCGGGTASLIAGEPRIWQADVAVNSFDFYQSAGSGEPGGLRAGGPGPGSLSTSGGAPRISLRVAQGAGEYLADIESGLQDIARRGPHFDLCLYNAGMDPFEGCSIGGLTGITREILAAREWLVFDWCRAHVGAVAFVPAGGYIGRGLDAAGLVDLHRLTLAAAAECDLAGEGLRQ